MNRGKLVFAQLMQHLPLTTFRRCVARYQGERKVKSFSCLDQFLCMAFAQLTYRESLRDIEACLRAQQSKLYHLGIRSAVARNTLANANAVRDWRIYADFAQSLIGIARRLYAGEPFGVDLKESVYALDTTTIDLCLSVFPWAPFRSTKAAVKLHTPAPRSGRFALPRGPVPSRRRPAPAHRSGSARRSRTDRDSRRACAPVRAGVCESRGPVACNSQSGRAWDSNRARLHSRSRAVGAAFPRPFSCTTRSDCRATRCFAGMACS